MATPDKDVFPVKPRDWVASRLDPGQVARVRSVYRSSGKVLVDLVFHGHDGTKLGRVSPAQGGPRGYEPACPYEDWVRISEPVFPIEVRFVPESDGRRVARRHHNGAELPDRAWRPRPGGGSVPAQRRSDFDPEMEASARRLAAQELRDVARREKVSSLLERAEALEQEAEAISPRGMR